jgi:hypothetical protein
LVGHLVGQVDRRIHEVCHRCTLTAAHPMLHDGNLRRCGVRYELYEGGVYHVLQQPGILAFERNCGLGGGSGGENDAHQLRSEGGWIGVLRHGDEELSLRILRNEGT